MKNFLKINRIKVFEKKDLLLKVDCYIWVAWLVGWLCQSQNGLRGLGRNQTVAIVKITQSIHNISFQKHADKILSEMKYITHLHIVFFIWF